MFGSDCIDADAKPPACIGAGTLALIRKLAPSAEIRRKILSENARKVFRI